MVFAEDYRFSLHCTALHSALYSTPLHSVLRLTALCFTLQCRVYTVLYSALHFTLHYIVPCTALCTLHITTSLPALPCPARYLLLTSAQFFPALGSTAHLSLVQLRFDRFCSGWFCTTQCHSAELKRLCTVLLSNGLYCLVVPITYLYCSGLLSNTQ